MSDKISYYSILNVQPDASISEIKKAYREQLLKWHPDINKSKKASERTRKIIEAWQVLQDAEKRIFYDSILFAKKRKRYK
jgi:DnaJ-class molecular chaperone